MSFFQRLAEVKTRVQQACDRSQRSIDDVRLVAVSKTRSAEDIREAYACGLRVFGENYVQELVSKAAALSDLPDMEWRCIGHLQRNKVSQLRSVPKLQVDSVDSERLLRRLAKIGDPSTLSILIQVNVAEEAQKSGCTIEDAKRLTGLCREELGVTVRGLMMIPPADISEDELRRHFGTTRELAGSLQLSTLSMGMSRDLEVAIQEGATEVRVGTALFGKRASSSSF